MPLSKRLPPTRPAGEPLAGAIHPRGEGADLLAAWTRTLGRVHGAKGDRTATAEFADLGYRDEGEYRLDVRTGEPLLQIPSAARFPELAFVHAVGRFLDERHLGDGAAPASETDPAVRAVVAAALAGPSLAESRAFVDETEAHAEFRRLLSPPEVFARAYGQYVAEMVRPPTLRMPIARRMTEIREAGALPLFWDREEFVPVARLLHDALLEKGLIALRG